MFKVIEGNVFLTDDQGDSLTTVSGADGPILKVATDIDLTISGGETLPVEITNVPLPVEEQNLDSEGYINNSAHNYAKIGANWSPFTLTDDGRLRIDIQTSADSHIHAFLDLSDTPTTYSGSENYYLKVKSTADGIEFVQHTGEDVSHFDLQDIGITTHSGIDVHIADGTIHFPWTDVEDLVETTSGTLQTQIDAKPDTFLDLTDTPSTYVGSARKLVRVTSTADGLEFLGGDDVDPDDTTLSGLLPHSYLRELEEDQHPALIPRDGSRGFTSTVSGIDPTETYHLTTRQFIEDYIGGTASGVEPPPIMFFIEYAVDETESSTNSTSYIQKLRITSSGCTAGVYRIGWSYFWRHSKLNTDFESRVQINDTTTVFEYIISPYVDVNVWRPVSAFHYEALEAGDNYIDFDFASSNPGSTSYVKEVSLELWRVE